MRLLSGVMTLETLLQVFTKCSLTSNGKIMFPGRHCFFQQIDITCVGCQVQETPQLELTPQIAFIRDVEFSATALIFFCSSCAEAWISREINLNYIGP